MSPKTIKVFNENRDKCHKPYGIGNIIMPYKAMEARQVLWIRLSSPDTWRASRLHKT